MSAYKGPALELKCVNTIRAVSADQPQAANSGHPGAPMGCAPMAYLLWSELMKYSGKSPKWLGRDRFVLSNGHACALQYTMLHLAGYNLTLDDLKQFRKLGSKTPGHPESFVTDGMSVAMRSLRKADVADRNGLAPEIGISMIHLTSISSWFFRQVLKFAPGLWVKVFPMRWASPWRKPI